MLDQELVKLSRDDVVVLSVRRDGPVKTHPRHRLPPPSFPFLLGLLR